MILLQENSITTIIAGVIIKKVLKDSFLTREASASSKTTLYAYREAFSFVRQYIEDAIIRDGKV